MADPGSYGGIRRKRRPKDRPMYHNREYNRDGYGIKNDYGHYDSREKSIGGPGTLPGNLLKQPIILAKPDSNSTKRSETSSPVNNSTKNMKPTMANSNMNNSDHARREKLYNDQKPIAGKLNLQKSHSTPRHTKHTPSPGSPMEPGMKPPNHVNSDKKPVKILDASLQWTDNGIELLEDQTQYLVVGVLGQQGVGKSMIMSCLAGSDAESKKLIFPVQTNDCMERSSNMTIGVDMFVTEERTIFLDSQPILSPALLEQCIYNDRKMSSEYNSPAVGIEMQALQLTTFFFTVCHVVIVVQDWFTDLKIYQFLECAEMLKLTSSSGSDGLNGESDFEEFYPHLIFVQNKAKPEEFEPTCLASMTETISNLLAHSKLLYKGSISLAKTNLFPNLSTCLPPSREVNLFLIPVNEKEEEPEEDKGNDDGHFKNFPKYMSTPGAGQLLRTFRNAILSIRRLRLTRQPLTEKNWFYYAAKTWEAIKKSQMMAEFNRLLV